MVVICFSSSRPAAGIGITIIMPGRAAMGWIKVSFWRKKIISRRFAGKSDGENAVDSISRAG
jgi:hypothetical protein